MREYLLWPIHNQNRKIHMWCSVVLSWQNWKSGNRTDALNLRNSISFRNDIDTLLFFFLSWANMNNTNQKYRLLNNQIPCKTYFSSQIQPDENRVRHQHHDNEQQNWNLLLVEQRGKKSEFKFKWKTFFSSNSQKLNFVEYEKLLLCWTRNGNGKHGSLS